MTTEDYNNRIQELESSVNAALEELVQLKKQRSSHEQVKDYELLNWAGGTTKLSELFGDKDDLIVVHNMGESCNFCTLWADGFNGFAKPFSDRAAFVVVSPDAPEAQQAFAKSRNWNFHMLSSQGSVFSEEMGFAYEKNDRKFHNPGYSTFRRQADGSIVRVAYDFFGPGDLYCAPWHMFALLEEGAGEWHPKKKYEV